MTSDGGAEDSPGQLPGIEGIVENDSSKSNRISGSKAGAQDESAQREFSTFMAQFHSGPDPQIAAIFAETERHAEDNRLAAYRESLAIRDAQAERDQSFRMATLKHSAHERTIVLYGSVVALVVGGAISFRGNPALGNPIMSAAMTLLITLVTGKLKFGE